MKWLLLIPALALAQEPPHPEAYKRFNPAQGFTTITVPATSVVTTVYTTKFLRFVDGETNFIQLKGTNIVSISVSNTPPVPE